MEGKEFLKEVFHGSRHAFKELLDEYIPLVSRTSYRIMCDRSDSEAVTEAVFISLWRDPLSYFTYRSLADELLRRTCKLCRRRLLRRRMYMLLSVHPDVFVVSAPVVPTVDEYVARQAWEVFCRASRNCSDKQKIVYTLCELEGLGIGTAADVGQYVAVDEALNQARARIKDELDYYGRLDDYDSYVGFLRKVEDQLTDRVKLQRDIMQVLFS